MWIIFREKVYKLFPFHKKSFSVHNLIYAIEYWVEIWGLKVKKAHFETRFRFSPVIFLYRHQRQTSVKSFHLINPFYVLCLSCEKYLLEFARFSFFARIAYLHRTRPPLRPFATRSRSMITFHDCNYFSTGLNVNILCFCVLKRTKICFTFFASPWSLHWNSLCFKQQ